MPGRRIVRSDADHELADRGCGGRSSGTPPVRIVPFGCDQSPVEKLAGPRPPSTTLGTSRCGTALNGSELPPEQSGEASGPIAPGQCDLPHLVASVTRTRGPAVGWVRPGLSRQRPHLDPAGPTVLVGPVSRSDGEILHLHDMQS